MIEIDPFANVFRQKFGPDSKPKEGGRGVLFRYYYSDSDSIRRNWQFMAGLWISESFDCKRIQTIHDMSDMAIDRAVFSARAHHRPSGPIWIGLPVERISTEDGGVNQFTIPPGILDDFSRLAISHDVPIKDELEQRFGVLITTS
ncbi:MAG TPA: hypothetical protein PKD20_05640 [Candidatus Saccharibacteria bacterium]|nr:hypothetical protein [Candidatus Saccharibacteria bacterium]